MSAELPIRLSLTMSSREIADLTGSTHDNVLKTVRALIAGGVVSGNETPYVHSQNKQTYTEFNLDYRNTMVVVSGYSADLRARIIDRWMELEAAAATPAPASMIPDLNDPLTLQTLLLQQAQGRIEDQRRAAEAEKQVAEMLPKVEAHDRIADAHGTFCRQTAAKMLGVPPNTLVRWLRTNGWTFRRPGDKDDLAYQSKIVAGMLEHKITTGPRDDGTEWSRTQVRVTPKGITALAKAFPPPAKEVA